MFEIIGAILIFNLIIYIYGQLFLRYLCIKDFLLPKDFAEISIFGIIFISFIALILNFFIPLNKTVGTIFILIALIPTISIIKNLQNKSKFFIYLLCTTFFSVILLYASNINRPDAGLYHLPYISLLNENKIIIGSTNIHFRFGHISIMQYLSAIYNNHLFNTSSVTVPLASIFSIFIIFLIDKISKYLKSKMYEICFIVFLILIYAIYAFSRYSAYGNDMPAHVYFFILCLFFLEIKKLKLCSIKDFYKISLVCIFLITLKTFMIIVSLIPLILFIILKKKKDLFSNSLFFISCLFLLAWLLKNILSSGCIIYPLEISCYDSLIYSNLQQTYTEQIAGEAWAKGWIDQKNSIIPHLKYINNFNWIETWASVHLKIIFTKISPFVVFVFFLYFYMIGKNFFIQNIKNETINLNQNIYIFTFFSFFCSMIWFVKFPLYRYGQSFLVIFFILTLHLFFFKFLFINKKKNFKKLYKTITVTALILFCIKNFVRINKDSLEKHDLYPWPNIYTLNKKESSSKNFKIMTKNNDFLYYYSQGELCMYSKSPCSNYKIDNLQIKKKFNYSVYFIKKN